ncbi:hypothetical protein PAECIP111802_03894 [Paenibacillus allorhizosphaerae]|uniref:Sulfatase N-terminal domain-containing protein n=1 Tax=Paenibacillus allorhizosphaerae TaxID=2849866 RepID=A0ABM8VKI4_9BACL|nr:hypothetical protein PAECIP111802_03894 [Paenibacillus allorhizosphaerae]
MFFILLQVISLTYTWVQAPPEPQFKKYVYDETNQFKFSAKENVIVLLLDTFQTDLFSELISENAEYKNMLSGFTYYPNTVGGFPTTYASVPFILTGQYYDNSVPMQQFVKEKYLTQSIPLVLRKHNFNVGLYPMVTQTVYPSEETASNVSKIKSFTLANTTYVKDLYQTTFFRYVPHFLKKYFYKVDVLNKDPEQHGRDVNFVERAEKKSQVGETNPTFKFYHLEGAHPPYNLNEKLERVKLEGREGYKTKANAALKITEKFLGDLKRIGVYDNSIIVIIGDHGGGEKVNVNAGTANDANYTNNSVVASGLPLMLYKPMNATGQLKISKVPASLSDISSTIVSELGINEKFPGQSLLTLKEDDERQRRFMFYSWEHEYWNKEYLPTMTEYAVNGYSWNKDSWIPTYRKYSSEGLNFSPPPTYEYGNQSKFGIGGDTTKYEIWGFSTPEQGFTWTDGKGASLSIPVKKADKDLILKITGFPFLAGQVTHQRVNVKIDGKLLTQWDITSQGGWEVKIPKELTNDDVIHCNLEFLDAVSPFDMKLSDDQRVLALALQSLVIDEIK